jgi:hypothetical protein
MPKIRDTLKRLFKSPPKLTQAQQAEAEREQRVAARDSVDYSYAVFWTKMARDWDRPHRARVWQQLTALIQSADFDPNPFDRHYTLDGVDGAHSGASLIALKKVLEAVGNL